MKNELELSRTDKWTPIAIAAAFGVFAVFFLNSNYLLFHTVAELFSACVALVVFSIAWHTRRISDSAYTTFVGIALLPVSAITLFHALAYKGMNVLPGDANLPTELWLIARVLQASALLVAPLFFTRRLRQPGVVLVTYAGVAIVLATLAINGFLPAAFIEGQGLTRFKVVVEYVVVAATLVGAISLAGQRRKLQASVLTPLFASMAATVLAELAFTLYNDPFGPANKFGHLATIGSFTLLYVALAQTSLERPLVSLFHRLSQREAALAEAFSAEHDVAETLQNAMALQPQRVAGLEMSHRYLPSPGVGRIGGDFYDLFRIDERLVGFSIGDVCGKGIRASMTTMKARSAIRALALGDPEPAHVLNAVNSYLYRELDDSSFVTAVFGTIDVKSGHARLAVAGHPYPLVCGRPEFEMPDELRAQPLGVLPQLGAGTWDAEVASGESLVLITDGVIDAVGEGGRFGTARLEDLLHGLNCAKSAEEVVDAVVDELRDYAGSELDDDVAVVAIRFAPEA